MTLYGNGSGPKIEALINGTWTDITSRVRGEQKAVISRGRANEQSRASAQTCDLTLENQDGYFSNRLPTSVNYGLIPRNTQLRVSAGTGDNYLRLPYDDQAVLINASTADKAVLDIVGDIDVRIELWPHTWRANREQILISKYLITGNQRSWVFYMDGSGYLKAAWSTDGTAGGRIFVTSTAAVPATSGHLAVRFTLDVNNGAAGNTAAFYTSPTIGGSWTQLGSSVVTAGVTSIFSSSADLTVGGGADVQSIFGGGAVGVGGKIYKAEVYNGIAGTRVANMDATAQTMGATSWSDGLTTPNTWTVSSGARITSDRCRFWGELASLPQRWDPTGADVFLPARASGMIRRLTQGETPLRSPMYRNFTQYSPHGYWSFEDGSDATVAASGVSGGTSATVTAVSFGAATTLPGADQTLAFTGSTGQIIGFANTAASTGTASFVFYTKLSSLPASTKVFATLYTTGTARKIEIGISSAAWNVEFFSSAGVSLGSASTAITSISPNGQWIGYNLLLLTSGGNFTYSVRWDVAGGTYGGGIGPTSLGAGSPGVFTGFALAAVNDTAFNDAQFGHVFMSTSNLDLSTSAFRNASNAYSGETAADRMKRLCSEEGITSQITGIYADSEAMGYQTTSTFMDLIYECWDADGGIGGEARDALALTYRTRVDLESREDGTLSYSSAQLSDTPEPTDDDQGITNDVTVRKIDASFARSIVDTGTNSVNAPPSGIGRLATDVTRNVSLDTRLPDIAGWLALVGSWDEARFPSLAVGLHRTEISGNATVAEQVMGLELGDTVILADLPAWVTYDDVPELIQGYTEILGKHAWDVGYNCTPAGPYRAVPVLVSDQFVPRLDAAAHTITSSLTTTATSVSLTTPATSQRWIDSATYASDFPFDIRVAGEVMTVTDISGTSSPQTATVTRSVNGVVKTHSAGETVRLASPFYLAL